MKLAANRRGAAGFGPVRPNTRNRQSGCGARGRAWRLGAATLALSGMLGLGAMAAIAQQTIVIGDDKPTGQGGAPIPSESTGVVVNDDVLNSLGGPGASAPALPPASPHGAPGQAVQPLAGTGAPGTAYRLPDTGQLVISRPSTLLFPPPVFPTSRLTVPPPAGSMARATPAPDAGAPQSRLMVPKPAEPSAPQVAQPKAMEPAAPTASAVPREPVIQAPSASTATAEPPPEAPAMADAPAPAETPAAAAPVEEPTPPPVAPLAPPAEPAAPTATAALPAAPDPAAEPATEPPAPANLTTDLQSATPREMPSAPEPAPSAAAPSATPEKADPAPATPTQSAALTPAASPIGETRVVFEDGSAELSAAASNQLANVAQELLSNSEARVQLLAYAKESGDGTSRARRLSLSRALAVRAYLIEKGVRSTRMDVRALGSGFDDGPADRVDILPIASTQ